MWPRRPPLSLIFAQARPRGPDLRHRRAGGGDGPPGASPFRERGAEPLLKESIGSSLIVFQRPRAWSPRPGACDRRHRHPVDEHLNPKFTKMRRFFVSAPTWLMVDGQVRVLRSTLFPGTTEKIRELVDAFGTRVSTSPTARSGSPKGKAARGAGRRCRRSSRGVTSGPCRWRANFFGKIAASLASLLTPIEAELAKIFTNTWRYIHFATSNQFLMIASDYGCDFYRIFDAVTATTRG